MFKYHKGGRKNCFNCGYASEIVAALGKADKLVGVDTTSVKPQTIMEKKPKIGYRRQLSAEGILSLTPDLIILALMPALTQLLSKLKPAVFHYFT